jgi:ABC-type antimicrobial peptide transport system permease subunit
LKFGLLSNAMDGVLHRNRAMALIATTFGLFVGLLAMIGVYGVTSYATAERTREIGIRMALGAKQGDVLRMVLGETMRVVCAGAALGVGAGVAATGMFREIIWGVRPIDPPSFGFGVCLVLLIAGIAAFLPAHRASKADPSISLRFE